MDRLKISLIASSFFFFIYLVTNSLSWILPDLHIRIDLVLALISCTGIILVITELRKKTGMWYFSLPVLLIFFIGTVFLSFSVFIYLTHSAEKMLGFFLLMMIIDRFCQNLLAPAFILLLVALRPVIRNSIFLPAAVAAGMSLISGTLLIMVPFFPITLSWKLFQVVSPRDLLFSQLFDIYNYFGLPLLGSILIVIALKYREDLISPAEHVSPDVF
jgi:hypothetical protein